MQARKTYNNFTHYILKACAELIVFCFIFGNVIFMQLPFCMLSRKPRSKDIVAVCSRKQQKKGWA